MIPPELRLRRAIHANDQLLVKRILNSHPHLLRNPDYADWSNSSLHLAASLGHLSLCQLLVDAGHEKDGPALNDRCETPLHLAARAGHIEVVHYLCQTYPRCILRIDNLERDAIMEASLGGHDTIVQILLTYFPGGPEAAVLRQDLDENTALHFASSNGHLLVLRTLLAAGANPEHRNKWCWTPVDYSRSVQAEVYLKSLIKNSEAQAEQSVPPAPVPAPVPTPSRRWKLGLGSSDKSKKVASSGLRIVRDEDK